MYIIAVYFTEFIISSLIQGLPNQVQYFLNDFNYMFLYCSKQKIPARKDTT